MITIFMFIIGAGFGILLTNVNAHFVLWAAFMSNVFIWLTLKVKA